MSNIVVNVAVIRNEELLLTKWDDFEVWCLPGGKRNEHAVLFRGSLTGGELRIQDGETIEVAYFPFVRLPDETLLGHKRRILDAIENMRGIVVKQELKNSHMEKASRSEPYHLRDQSNLSRRQFCLQLVQDMEINDTIEVDGQ